MDSRKKTISLSTQLNKKEKPLTKVKTKTKKGDKKTNAKTTKKKTVTSNSKSRDKEDSVLVRVLTKLITKDTPKKTPSVKKPRGYKGVNTSLFEKPKLIKLTTPKDTKLDDLDLDEKEKDDLDTYVQLIKGEKKLVDNAKKDEFADHLIRYEKELSDISSHLKNEYNPSKYNKISNYLAKQGGVSLQGDNLFY